MAERTPVDNSSPSRWEILSRERNARVILCNTPDTYALLDIVRSADRAVRNLRNRILITLTPEQVIPLLERYHQVAKQLHEVTQEMCELADTKYFYSRSLKRLFGNSENADDSPEGSDRHSADSDTDEKR